jgi:hypothetical protein
MKRLVVGGIFSRLAAFEGKSVVPIRRLIIIATTTVLSTPAIGQGYGGLSAEDIQNAVRDGVLDALQDSSAEGLSRVDIQDAVRDGILAADEERRRQREFQGFLHFIELLDAAEARIIVAESSYLQAASAADRSLRRILRRHGRA